MFKCFLICPFGSETRGDEEKRLFDQLKGLRRFVFNPTVGECRKQGYEIAILDARDIEHRRTHIEEAVQECIDEAAAVIVLLTADKPNVYLELGWAQGMWHTPIFLQSDGYKMPVDINNKITIEFSSTHADGTDKLGAKRVAKKLADQIAKRITVGRNDKQFKHWPSTTLARGAIHIYNRFSKAVTPDEWSAMVEEAQAEIIFASTSMSRILGQRFFVKNDKKPTSLDKLLLKKAQDGANVTILLYHKENLTIGHLKQSRENDLDDIHDNLEKSFEKWSTQRLIFEATAARSAVKMGSFRVIQIRNRHLPFRVTLTERRVLATLRFYTEIYNSGLTIEALSPPEGIDRDKPEYRENMPVYDQIRTELDFLIEENVGRSEMAYEEWKERRRA